VKFGILTQWFDPEPGGGAIPGALARELVLRGHEVTVVTGFPNYPTGLIYPGYSMQARIDTWEDGVHVRRVALYPSHDSSQSRRMLNYGSFALSSTTLGLAALRGLDAIWVYNSPASIAIPMWASKYLLGVPHVLHVMDLWPDSILLSGFGGNSLSKGIIHRALDTWCSTMYKTAASVAYVSPGLSKELVNRGVPESKLHYVPVWADETATQVVDPIPRSHWNVTDDDLLMLYAGTIGASQGLDTVIEALALLDRGSKVTCLFAGTGTAVTHLKSLAQERGLNNVIFLGQVPREQMPGIMAAADLHIVSLRDSPLALITMPSKIQSTLACGKPFIAILNGDAKDSAVESGSAFPALPGNPASVAQAIRTALLMDRQELAAMGRRGMCHYKDNFAAELGVDKIESLLVSAAHRI